MEFELLSQAFWAFICFNLAASSIYIINDWRDIDKDRLHPKKKLRPLASGKIKVKTALFLSLILLISSFYLAFNVLGELPAVLVLGVYVLQNLLYTFKLKNIAIIDITIVSIGFVLRIIMGGIVTGIVLSHWIVLMTFLLSLFMALAKRRDDVLVFERTKVAPRKVIVNYNLDFINTTMSITAAVVIVTYIMYTLSDEVMERLGKNVYLTSIFVIVAIMQYLKLTQVKEFSASPVAILYKSILLQLLIAGWALAFVILVYFDQIKAFFLF